MRHGVGRPCVGQWYVRRDRYETFQVMDIDERTATVEIQTFDGDLDVIDLEVWPLLPLGLAEPPDDCSGAIDLQGDDLDQPESETAEIDGLSHGETLIWANAVWEDPASEEDDMDAYLERAGPTPFH
jgi:hypothetical protein